MDCGYEIYYGLTGKHKKYIVADKKTNVYDFNKYAKHLFHCSTYDVFIVQAWIYDGYLYLDNPHKKKQTTVMVAYYRKEKKNG